MFSKKKEEEEEGEKEKKKKKKQKERRKKKWWGSGGDTRHISMATHRLDHLQARNRTQQQAMHASMGRTLYSYLVLVKLNIPFFISRRQLSALRSPICHREPRPRQSRVPSDSHHPKHGCRHSKHPTAQQPVGRMQH